MWSLASRRWSYEKKKSKNPEKASERQKLSPENLGHNIITKGASPVPIIGSFGGMIFSGFTLGIPETIVICVVAVLVNVAYYGRPILAMVFDFVLELREQNYNQSISKSEANQQTAKMRQMELDHEYRMAKLDKEGYNKNDISNSSIIPPANVADENHKYYSWICKKQSSSTFTLQKTKI